MGDFLNIPCPPPPLTATRACAGNIAGNKTATPPPLRYAHPFYLLGAEGRFKVAAVPRNYCTRNEAHPGACKGGRSREVKGQG